ncbi:MAG: autotransporter domain-containing protein [Rickettsiales bacterium]|nr:autotransporter domain-containing protein [Rickettsiales bacterium]
MKKILPVSLFVSVFSISAFADIITSNQYISNGETKNYTDPIAENMTDTYPGVVFYNEGELNITNGEFNTNSTTGNNGFGGVIMNLNTIGLKSTVFDKNTAEKSGGAIYNVGSANMDETHFSENTGAWGGAIYNDGGELEITNSLFSKNIGTTAGGAISSSNTINIEKSTFSENESAWGGAIYSTGDINIKESLFVDNDSGANYGGAIYIQGGQTDISDSNFSGNTASGGGAISASTASGITISITDSLFENNSVTVQGGGAISNYSWGDGVIVDNTIFRNNQTTGTTLIDGTAAEGGGAMFFGSDSATSLTNSQFINNTSVMNGGAISMRANRLGDQSSAKLDISDTTFNTNVASGNGGAIFNTFYGSAADADFVKINNSIFSNNTAVNGGAVYNDGTGDKIGGIAAIKFVGATFTDNIATTNGGAIYNAGGDILFSGGATFSGNKANGVLNDIYNTGTLTFDGGIVALDGGIVGAGEVEFTNGTSLKASLTGTNPIITTSKLSGTINLVVTNVNGGQIVFDAGEDTLVINNNNSLYDITGVSGTWTIAKRNTDEILSNIGASNEDAEMVAGIMAGDSNNDSFNSLQNEITALMQNDYTKATAIKMLREMAPTKAPTIVSNSVQTTGAVMKSVGTRFSGGGISSGMSSGDYVYGDTAVWAQGLYNKSKLTGANGYKSDSYGISAGLESELTRGVKLGLGYAFTETTIEPFANSTDINSNTFVLYGEYKPLHLYGFQDAGNWYVNSILSYTNSVYDNDNKVGLNHIMANYETDTLAAQMMTGYDIHAFDLNSNKLFTMTPEIGLRYMNIKQYDYTNSIGSFYKGKKYDILTGLAGVKLATDFYLSDNFMLRPELRIGLTYDMYNADGSSVMRLANGSTIVTNGGALDRLATEIGFGLTASLSGNVDFSLIYEGQFRDGYSDNTGIAMLKIYF